MFAAVPAGGDPRAVGGGIADQMGGITLCQGILTALVARSIHGVGQKVDVSHLGSLIWLQGLAISMGLLNGAFLPPGDRTNAANPLSNSYRCKDDNWLQFVNLQSDRYWPTWCKLLNLEHLVEDPKFSTLKARAENARELIQICDKVFATKTADEWEKLIRSAGDLVYARVQRWSDLPNDPQVIANDYITNVQHPVLGKIKLANHPVRFSETPTSIRSVAPELGENTEEILLSLGYTWEQIAELREKGAL
jgi:crotonobetainyl-CoA:carnitine CoA-transferase CaiB-like acyl-CoA transferase